MLDLQRAADQLDHQLVRAKRTLQQHDAAVAEIAGRIIALNASAIADEIKRLRVKLDDRENDLLSLQWLSYFDGNERLKNVAFPAAFATLMFDLNQVPKPHLSKVAIKTGNEAVRDRFKQLCEEGIQNDNFEFRQREFFFHITSLVSSPINRQPARCSCMKTSNLQSCRNLLRALLMRRYGRRRAG